MTSLRRSGGSGDGGGGSKGSGGGRTSSRCGVVRWGVSGGGQMQLQRRPRKSLPPQQLQFGDAAELPRWLELLRQGVDIFALEYDAILTALYALTIGTEGDCSLCVLPDPGIEAAALGTSEFALPGTAPAEALHTFTLDSGASCCFFHDSTTLTPLSPPVPVKLADPSGGPVLARSSTVLPFPAVPSGSLSGLHPPSFFTNLVSTAALQDAMVTTTTLGGQRVSICTCIRTGHHLATFTHRPGSSLYTLATEPPHTLLWHHRPGHPSLPRLRGMHSCLLVSGLPRSLPPLPPLPASPCLPCVEGRQRAAPHSSSFPSTTAPLQTLHMDVWGPARVIGQGRERYFLLVVDHYTRYTTVFPLRSKGDVPDVLIPWIRAPFAVRYAAHQLNLWPRVSLPKTSPTLRWTGEFGDSSVFRVWGSRAFVRDTSADKLSARTIPCVFLGFPPDAPGWQFYHPTSRRLIPFQDVTFDETVPPLVDPLPPQGPAPSGVSRVHPLPGTVPVKVAVASSAARGAASRGASSGSAEPRGSESEGAGSGGAELGGAEPGGCGA
ncbi:unnamed protein product [Closterium sp. NIES-53]